MLLFLPIIVLFVMRIGCCGGTAAAAAAASAAFFGPTTRTIRVHVPRDRTWTTFQQRSADDDHRKEPNLRLQELHRTVAEHDAEWYKEFVVDVLGEEYNREVLVPGITNNASNGVSKTNENGSKLPPTRENNNNNNNPSNGTVLLDAKKNNGAAAAAAAAKGIFLKKALVSSEKADKQEAKQNNGATTAVVSKKHRTSSCKKEMEKRPVEETCAIIDTPVAEQENNAWSVPKEPSNMKTEASKRASEKMTKNDKTEAGLIPETDGARIIPRQEEEEETRDESAQLQDTSESSATDSRFPLVGRLDAADGVNRTVRSDESATVEDDSNHGAVEDDAAADDDDNSAASAADVPPHDTPHYEPPSTASAVATTENTDAANPVAKRVVLEQETALLEAVTESNANEPITSSDDETLVRGERDAASKPDAVDTVSKQRPFANAATTGRSGHSRDAVPPTKKDRVANTAAQRDAIGETGPNEDELPAATTWNVTDDTFEPKVVDTASQKSFSSAAKPATTATSRSPDPTKPDHVLARKSTAAAATTTGDWNDTEKETATEETNRDYLGFVVEYRDLYGKGRGVKTVPLATLTELGYRVGEIPYLQPDALDLIAQDKIRKPQGGLPPHWMISKSQYKVLSEDVRIVPKKNVQEEEEEQTATPLADGDQPKAETRQAIRGSTLSNTDNRRGQRQTRTRDSGQPPSSTQRRDDTVHPQAVRGSSNQMQDSQRQPMQESAGGAEPRRRRRRRNPTGEQMEEGTRRAANAKKRIYTGRGRPRVQPRGGFRNDAPKKEKKKRLPLWVDMDTFRGLLAAESEMRLRILGRGWTSAVREEANWRMDTYSKWLEMLDKGVGKPMFESRSDRERRRSVSRDYPQRNKTRDAPFTKPRRQSAASSFERGSDGGGGGVSRDGTLAESRFRADKPSTPGRPKQRSVRADSDRAPFNDKRRRQQQGTSGGPPPRATKRQ